jgi:hypothetical protein
MQYFEHELALSQYQLKQLADAIEKKKKVTLRLSIDQLTFNTDDTKLKVLLTQTQIGRINKRVRENRGIEIDFSLNQLRQMSKSGGILPLLTLLPLIFGGLSAAGAVAGTVGDQVHKKLQRDEAERHNKAVEEEARKAATGSGLYLSKDGDGLYLSKEGRSMQLNEDDIGKLFSHLLLKKKL